MSELQPAEMPVPRQAAEPFVRRLRISNYKSIGKCDVELAPLTILVGRNGSGKSNCLDALRFVADGLQTSLDHAIKARGGIEEVRRRSTGHPRHFAVALDLNLADSNTATYGFEIATRKSGGFVVRSERLRVWAADGDDVCWYEIEEGVKQRSSIATMPPPTEDRLFLVNAAGLSQFREVYTALLSMGFYNLNPDAMKELRPPDAGELLHRDGSNIASVIARLQAHNGTARQRIRSYLETIVPGITDVERVALGPRETLQFKQIVEGSPHPWNFYASSMSDGTLRAFGTLVAVTQLADRKQPVRLVGIEEPETALHPAAAGALVDALREATAHTQVVVTTHSPELLDQLDLASESLLVVQSRQGSTELAQADPASRQAIREHLYTAGDLLRMDQLAPDQEELDHQEQLRLSHDNKEDA
jgi:predicted ATPase